MAEHFDLRWDDVQLLAGVRADQSQCTAVVRADFVGLSQVVNDLFARQVRRNAFGLSGLALMCRHGDGVGHRRRIVGTLAVAFIEQAALQRVLCLTRRAELLLTQVADKLFKLVDVAFLLLQLMIFGFDCLLRS